MQFPLPILGIREEDAMSKAYTDSTKITNIDSITVSAAVLGELFGVTDRRIRQMAEEGTVTRAAKGRYKLVDSVKNYVLTLKFAVDSPDEELNDGEISYDKEKALHERTKRRISELKFRTMKGELHRADDVKTVMTNMLASFKTRLMGIPSKTAPILEDRDAAYIKDRLTKEVMEVLNELKDYNPKDFYNDEYIAGDSDDE